MALKSSRRVRKLLPHRADNYVVTTPKVSTTPTTYYRVTATPTIVLSLLPTILGTDNDTAPM